MNASYSYTWTFEQPEITIVIPYHITKYLKPAYDSAIKAAAEFTGKTGKQVAILLLQNGSCPVVRWEEAKTVKCPYPSGLAPGLYRNYAIRHVTSPFIVFLDCDDTLCPEILTSCYRAFNEAEKHAEVCDVVVYKMKWMGNLAKHFPVMPPDMAGTIGYMIKTDFFLELGMYDTNMPIFEDCDFKYRMEKSGRMQCLDEILYIRRARADSISAARSKMFDADADKQHSFDADKGTMLRTQSFFNNCVVVDLRGKQLAKYDKIGMHGAQLTAQHYKYYEPTWKSCEYLIIFDDEDAQCLPYFLFKKVSFRNSKYTSKADWDMELAMRLKVQNLIRHSFE